jgi:hypothetical protein
MPDQPRPETRRFATALKGKPETGLYAAVIGPQLIIRSPSAAPFEFRQLHPMPTCQLANLPAIGVWPTGQLINRSTRLASHLCTFAQAVGRFAPLHCLFLFHRASKPLSLRASHVSPVPPCHRVNLPPLILVSRVPRTLRLSLHHTPRTTWRSRAWRRYCR